MIDEQRGETTPPTTQCRSKWHVQKEEEGEREVHVSAILGCRRVGSLHVGGSL
jgi:hypothetical protein